MASHQTKTERRKQRTMKLGYARYGGAFLAICFTVASLTIDHPVAGGTSIYYEEPGPPFTHAPDDNSCTDPAVPCVHTKIDTIVTHNTDSMVIAKALHDLLGPDGLRTALKDKTNTPHTIFLGMALVLYCAPEGKDSEMFLELVRRDDLDVFAARGDSSGDIYSKLRLITYAALLATEENEADIFACLHPEPAERLVSAWSSRARAAEYFRGRGSWNFDIRANTARGLAMRGRPGDAEKAYLLMGPTDCALAFGPYLRCTIDGDHLSTSFAKYYVENAIVVGKFVKKYGLAAYYQRQSDLPLDYLIFMRSEFLDKRP